MPRPGLTADLNPFSDPVDRLRILVGFLALLLGVLVYIADRTPDDLYFVSFLSLPFSLNACLPQLFGPLGNHGPSFFHVFAFIMISAGVAASKKRGCVLICLTWLGIDFFFEAGQYFGAQWAGCIPEWLAGIPFVENTAIFFRLGTFDLLDLAATALGTGAALCLLLIMERPLSGNQNRVDHSRKTPFPDKFPVESRVAHRFVVIPSNRSQRRTFGNETR